MMFKLVTQVFPRIILVLSVSPVTLLLTGDGTLLTSAEPTDSLSEKEYVGCEGAEAYLQCPSSTYLDILDAEFGRTQPSSIICPYKHLAKYRSANWDRMDEELRCIYADALEKVQKICQDRRSCMVKASARHTFQPDPCPNTGKYLKITYKCIPMPNRSLTGTVCKDKTLSLSCVKGKRILISSAHYGFDDTIPHDCADPRRLLSDTPTGCFSQTAAAKVKEFCHTKRTCNILASQENFGNFCPGIGKYLKVSYSCRRVPKNLKNADGTVPDEFDVEKLSTAGDSSRNSTNGNYFPPAVLDHKHTPADSSLVFGWIHSISYIKDNQEKIVLYGMLCGCLAFICALVVFIARMFYVRYRKARLSTAHQKLNVTEPHIQDTSNEENTYIAAADPSDMMQYNLGYRSEATNRLNSGPNSYRGSSATRVYNTTPETPRFNTNSLTVTNPLHGEHRRNFNHSPLTTTSTAMNNSPNTAISDNRNTYYENSADDEHTNDDNDPMLRKSHSILYNRPDSGPDVRPRTNSLFDRHS